MIFPGMARHMWHPPDGAASFVFVVHRVYPCLRATMSNVHFTSSLSLIAPPATFTGAMPILALLHRKLTEARSVSPVITTLAEIAQRMRLAVQRQLPVQRDPIAVASSAGRDSRTVILNFRKALDFEHFVVHLAMDLRRSFSLMSSITSSEFALIFTCKLRIFQRRTGLRQTAPHPAISRTAIFGLCPKAESRPVEKACTVNVLRSASIT